jgi:hypothetical protein
MAGCEFSCSIKTQQVPPFPELKSFQIPFGNTINDGERFENGLNPLKLLLHVSNLRNHLLNTSSFKTVSIVAFLKLVWAKVGKVKVTKF